MKLTKQEVKHISDLARLEISDKEIDFYAEELSVVLGYVEKLQELDTEKIEPTSNISKLDSIIREDEHREGATVSAETLMRLVPFKEKGMAKVKSVFKAR